MTILDHDPFEGKKIVRAFKDEYNQECIEYDDGSIVVKVNPETLEQYIQDKAGAMIAQVEAMDREVTRLREVIESDAFKFLMKERKKMLEGKRKD